MCKKLLPSDKTKGLTVSTFHQFGLQFLRYELLHTPLKGNFSIMDAEDSKRLLMDLMVRDNMSGAESRELVGKAIKMISDWKNDLIPLKKQRIRSPTLKICYLQRCINSTSVTYVPTMRWILMT